MPDLSDNLNWSEVDANNNMAPPNGWPEGMMPSGVNDAARADRGAMKRFWNKLNPIQLVYNSGGVYTFTTGNTSYPTAYVSGELYCFMPNDHSVGNDQFQVNSLGPKPIWKRVVPGLAPGAFAPIIAYDILGQNPVQLAYNSTLNAGYGAFVLLNPYQPIHNDGSGMGGASVFTSLVINRTPAPPPPVLNAPALTLQIVGNNGESPVCALNSFGGGSGGVCVLRFIHAEGTAVAPAHTNAGDGLGNLGWEGYGATGWAPTSARIQAIALENFTDFSQGTEILITATPAGQSAPVQQVAIGPGLTVGAPPAPSGGMLVGDLNAQRMFSQGAISAGGQLFVAGEVSAIGYQSRSGVAGSFQNNNFNIQWTGSAAHLWIDNSDQGPIVTGAGGTISADVTVGGALNVTGATTLGSTLSSGPITATGLTVNGNGSVTGTLTAGAISSGALNSSTLNTGAITGTGLTVNGTSILGGHLNITSGGAGITGDVSMGGALGIDGVLTAAGNRIVVEGSNAPSLTMYNTGTGSAQGMWSGGGNLNFGEMDGGGNPVAAWGYFASNGDLYLDYNLHVAGTLNGHPASVFDTLITQLQELTSRVATLEAEVQTLRGHV